MACSKYHCRITVLCVPIFIIIHLHSTFYHVPGHWQGKTPCGQTGWKGDFREVLTTCCSTMKCCTPRHSFPFTESLGFICPTHHGAEKRDAVSVLFLWCLMMAWDFDLWVILDRFLSWKQLNLGNACWTFVVLSSWIQRRGVDMHQFHRPLNLRHLRDSIGGSMMQSFPESWSLLAHVFSRTCVDMLQWLNALGVCIVGSLFDVILLEVLILHKPLENFNLMNARRVLDLLRQRKGDTESGLSTAKYR